jgi:hypothetical protein
MASPTLQFKRGLFVNLPGLRAGEPGFTTDKYDLYVGLSSSTETNQFFGSARYWTRENGTDAAQFKLVDKDGTSGVSLRAPATVSTPVTYTLPQGGGTTGHFLKLGSAGVLEWASVTSGASFDSVTISNSTFTGISTFSGLIEADGGIDVTGNAEFDDINVSGVGTIATADINGGNIDGTVIGASSAAAGTFTELAYDNSTTSGISTVGELYIGTTQVLYDNGGLITLAGIQTVDATTIATLEDLLSLDPNDFDTLNVTGIGTIGGLLNADGGLDVTGLAELDTVNVSVAATFASATVSDLTSGRVVLAGTGGELEDSANLTFDGTSLTVGTGVGITQFSASVSTGTSTSSVPTSSAVIDYVATQINAIDQDDDLGIAGDSGTGTIDLDTQSLTIAGTANEIRTSVSGQTVTVGLATDVTVAGTLTVGGNEIYASDGASAITLTDTTGDVTLANDLTVINDSYVDGSSYVTGTLYVDAIAHYDGISPGSNAITIDSSSNVGVSTNLTVSNNLTVQGDLFVNGATTTVNTETLLVKDSLIEVGLVDNSGNLVPPSSDANIDAGLIFHYFDTSAKKAAVYWDDSVGRIKVASEVTEASSILTAVTNGSLEIGGLYVAGCGANPVEVIGCVNSEVTITNAIIDGGTF